MNPAHPRQLDLVRRPRVGDGVDDHSPPLAFVVDREGGGRRRVAATGGNRQAEADERRGEQRGRSAAAHLATRRSRACRTRAAHAPRTGGAAPGARSRAVHAVEGDIEPTTASGLIADASPRSRGRPPSPGSTSGSAGAPELVAKGFERGDHLVLHPAVHPVRAEARVLVERGQPLDRLGACPLGRTQIATGTTTTAGPRRSGAGGTRRGCRSRGSRAHRAAADGRVRADRQADHGEQHDQRGLPVRAIRPSRSSAHGGMVWTATSRRKRAPAGG